MTDRNIIVMGASAGGVEAFQELTARLAPDIPAAIFIVLHLAPGGPSMMPEILSRSSRLSVAHAVDGEPIEHGRIYVAPPDLHMLLKPGYVRLLRGAKENHARPAVDPLFRSAARAYGQRVVGVVLTGMLDDGTAGLKEVQSHGGVTVVQDPGEAAYSSMPQSAIKHVDVNHILPIAEIGPLLSRLAHERAELEGVMSTKEVPDVLERIIDGTCDPVELGKPSGLSCPECGGSLSEKRDGNLTAFRCRVGHAFSPAYLDSAQGTAVEDSLWAAVRALQEREALMRRMTAEMELTGSPAAAARFAERAEKMKEHAARVQQVFLNQRSVEDKNALRG